MTKIVISKENDNYVAKFDDHLLLSTKVGVLEISGEDILKNLIDIEQKQKVDFSILEYQVEIDEKCNGGEDEIPCIQIKDLVENILSRLKTK